MKQLNFERKLIDWYESNKGRQIKWGTFDCVLSTFEGLSIVYGEVLTPPHKWTSRKSAIKIYRKLDSLVQSFLDLGFEIGTNALTGDVLILKTLEMHTSCIVINDKYTVIDEYKGLQLRKISEIIFDYVILRRNT